MGNDRLVLADGTEITLESSQGMGALNVLVKSKAEACALWEKFTERNVADVALKNEEGTVQGDYHGMVLDHITGTDATSGGVRITFSLRSKSREEILEERIAALEAGQMIQDDAIGDLGQAVSDITEQA